MSVATQIIVNDTSTETGTLDTGTATARHAPTTTINLTDGTAANQADKVWSDTRTLAASTSEDLDLSGVLTGPFGNTVSFAKVKSIYVSAASGNTNNVVVGGASATQFVGPFGAATHTIAVPPGGVFLIAGPALAGIGAVSNGATDLLKIANSGAGTSVTYTIKITGTSA